MPACFTAATLILLVLMVITRVVMLRRRGIEALQFGKIDKTDFILPPFALLYCYLILAHAFGWPGVRSVLFSSQGLAWVGVAVCLAGLCLMAWALVSFGRNFRVGIDVEHPGGLVSAGAFGFSRNPIYVAFAFVLLGQFLVIPNMILLIYLVAGFAMFHRQVLREEAFLKVHYGEEYGVYCSKVRRYL